MKVFPEKSSVLSREDNKKHKLRLEYSNSNLASRFQETHSVRQEKPPIPNGIGGFVL